MKLFYVVAVEVDEERIVDDRPPESVPTSIADEIKSNLESVDSVFAITRVDVQQIGGPLRLQLDEAFAQHARTVETLTGGGK